jgi:hypothetical protein
MNLRLLSRAGDQTMANEPSWIEARSGPEADVLELAEDLRKAELRGDVAFLERVLAPNFAGIGPRGFVLNKAAWLGRHRSGDLKYERLERSDVGVRTYTDSAILLCTEESQTTYKGQPVSIGALRATYTFVRFRGSWHLAGAQYSPIQGAP